MSEVRNPGERRVNRLVNTAMIGLVIAAWCAARYPDLRVEITISAVFLGVIASSFAFAMRHFAEQDGEECGEAAPKSFAHSQFVPVVTDRWSEIEESVRVNLLKGMIVDQQYAWHRLIEIESTRRDIHSLMKNSYYADRRYCPPVRLARGVVDIAPSDPENYTVQVGQVVVEVKNGVASVNLGAGKIVDGATESADMLPGSRRSAPFRTSVH